MLKSSKESFDWDLNTVITERNKSVSVKGGRFSPILNYSSILTNRMGTPNPRNVMN